MDHSISELAKLWDKVLARVEKKIKDGAAYSSFFQGSYINSSKGNELTVCCPSELAAQLLSSKYSKIVESSLADVSDETYTLVFISSEEAKASKVTTSKQNVVEQSGYFQSSFINDSLTFDTFVTGEFNKEASQAALMISRNPGKMFNPLFMYSNSGLGKTHLLHSIGNAIKAKNPRAKILYITANDFVEEYIKYVRADSDSESLKDYFKTVDVLLLDDVQFLKDKVKTEEMFFYVYSSMINAGKQIVITSDKQPSELSGLEDRLVSRFSQGLVVKIKDPDIKTCEEILKKKISSNDLELDRFDPEVITFFAERFSKNVRELEGAVNRLIFYTTTNPSKRVTLETAAEAVESFKGGRVLSSQLNEERIVSVVANYYGLSVDELKGKSRVNKIVLARHVAMYLIKYKLQSSYEKIGDTFGKRDHTTVMSGISKVEKTLKTDEALKVAIDDIQKKIK